MAGDFDFARLLVGGLYSTRAGERFGVIKILALDPPDAVHVRVYKQTFDIRPSSLNPKSLTLGRFDDPEGLSIGHVPLSPGTFQSWQPLFMQRETVEESELDGYRIWQESKGRVWG